MVAQIDEGEKNSLRGVKEGEVNLEARISKIARVNYFIILLILLISFVLFGLVGYFLGRKSLSLSKKSKERGEQRQQKEFSQAQDLPAGWKKYSDDKLGFELSYPAEWSACEEGPNLEMLEIRSGGTISGTNPPRYNTINFSNEKKEKRFEIAIFDSYKSFFPTSIKELIDGYLYIHGYCDIRWGFTPESLETVDVNNISFLKVRGYEQTKNSKKYTICYYAQRKGGNLFVLSYGPVFSNDEASFDQILTTFKLR